MAQGSSSSGHRGAKVELSVLQAIRRYYSDVDTDVRVHHEAVSRTKEHATSVARYLDLILARVEAPQIEEYAKCVKIRGYLDSDAAAVPASREAVLDYIASKRQPYVGFGVFLSWVAPCALVRLGCQTISPTGELIVDPSAAPAKAVRTRDAIQEAVARHPFQVLTEQDLLVPVEVDLDVVRRVDGSLVLPPLNVGKCLFYPWWEGNPAPSPGPTVEAQQTETPDRGG